MASAGRLERGAGERGMMHGAGDDLASLMLDPRQEPRPLLLGEGKIGIVWSAKSACTTVLLWYLWHRDLLHAARAHHNWPHRFRNER
ncbi:MAG: hypothetical protein AB7P12_19555, partial [Alphaproteobacteria bacterium]